MNERFLLIACLLPITDAHGQDKVSSGLDLRSPALAAIASANALTGATWINILNGCRDPCLAGSFQTEDEVLSITGV